MVTKRLATIVAVSLAAMAATAVFTVPRLTGAGERTICAQFTDAVGLYPGNNVQLLGVTVGSVSSVANEPDHVRVDFTVPADLQLPADVGAVTYTQSIVTDRHVELTKPYAEGPQFTGSDCIALQRTKTPIGISERLAATTHLADTILDPDPGKDLSQSPGAQAIRDTMAATANALRGTGDQLHYTMQGIVAVIGDPYQADIQYRALIANLEAFNAGWLKHWDTFSTLMNTLPATADLLGGLSTTLAAAIEHIVHLVPTLVDNINQFAPRIYKNISDKAVPWIRDLLNAYTPAIVAFIQSQLPFFNWLNNIYDPQWGTTHVTYVPPRVTVQPTQIGAICERLRNNNIPGADTACAGAGGTDPVTLGFTDLVLGAAIG